MDLSKLPAQATRQDVISLYGEPEEKGGTSRKHKQPLIFRYKRRFEFWFEPRKDGKLERVYRVNYLGDPVEKLWG